MNIRVTKFYALVALNIRERDFWRQYEQHSTNTASLRLLPPNSTDQRNGRNVGNLGFSARSW